MQSADSDVPLRARSIFYLIIASEFSALSLPPYSSPLLHRSFPPLSTLHIHPDPLSQFPHELSFIY